MLKCIKYILTGDVILHFRPGNVFINPLSANPTKWSNSLKHFVSKSNHENIQSNGRK